MLPIWTWPPQSDRAFWDFYNKGKWGSFPLTESNQIIRISVVGPGLFNTLVVVRGFFPLWAISGGHAGDDNLYHSAYSVRTAFKLAGFSGQQPEFKHSTAAALRHVFLGADTSFTAAIDSVEGRFDDDGSWLLDVEIGYLWGEANYAAHFHFSSFVLCHEPPADLEKNPGKPYTGPFEQPVWPDPR